MRIASVLLPILALSTALGLAACGDITKAADAAPGGPDASGTADAAPTGDAGLCEAPPDPTPGDCHTLACTENSPDPEVVIDDSDVPDPLPCSLRGCSNGEITAPVADEGTPCNGQSGVCDGLGTDANSCHTAVFATWDPTWSIAGITYSTDNLSISGNGPGTKTARTTIGRSSGKYYWEIYATGGDGNTNAGGIGIMESITPPSVSYIGAQESGISFGYGSCCFNQYWFVWPNVTVNGAPPAGSAINNGIIYIFALDMDTGKFWAGQNNTWYNGGDPATGANPAATGISGTVYPGVTFYDSSINSFTADFGATPMVYTPPAGFTPGFF